MVLTSVSVFAKMSPWFGLISSVLMHINFGKFLEALKGNIRTSWTRGNTRFSNRSGFLEKHIHGFELTLPIEVDFKNRCLKMASHCYGYYSFQFVLSNSIDNFSPNPFIFIFQNPGSIWNPFILMFCSELPYSPFWSLQGLRSTNFPMWI